MNSANIMNNVNKTKLKMLRENESVTLIFFLHKDPINANIFPKEEQTIPPQFPLLAIISQGFSTPFVLM